MFFGLRKYLPLLALIYWISPIDLIPLVPADDILFGLAAAVAYFVLGNSRGSGQDNFQHGAHQKDDDVITTTWSVVDDD